MREHGSAPAAAVELQGHSGFRGGTNCVPAERGAFLKEGPQMHPVPSSSAPRQEDAGRAGRRRGCRCRGNPRQRLRSHRGTWRVPRLLGAASSQPGAVHGEGSAGHAVRVSV